MGGSADATSSVAAAQLRVTRFQATADGGDAGRDGRRGDVVGQRGRRRDRARLGRLVAGGVDRADPVGVGHPDAEPGVAERGRADRPDRGQVRPVAVELVALDPDRVGRAGPGQVDLAGPGGEAVRPVGVAGTTVSGGTARVVTTRSGLLAASRLWYRPLLVVVLTMTRSTRPRW